MHDFAPGAAVQTSDPVSDGPFGAPVDLFWSDPLGAATSDYDVEVTFVPFPEYDGQQFSIIIVKFAGNDRFLHLDAFRGRFADQPATGLTGYSTAGELRGHAATAAAFATAAAPAADPLPFDLEEGDPPNPSGPFPGVFTSSQLTERFSSDGPRRVFFNADGTPITPGNFSSTGGVVRQKPDITAADGVSMSLEPGESAPLNVRVTNNGDTLARRVHVALSTTTPGVTITPASRAYNRVAKGASKLSPRPWRISLAPGYPLGKPVQLLATVTFLGALSPTSAEQRVLTGQPDTTTHSFAYTGPAIPIPDADETGITVPFSVSGVGAVSKATCSVDGTACSTDEGSTTVGIDHTFVSDLVATLTSPSRTSVAVFSRDGSDGVNMCQAVFDDSATRSIDDATADDAPYTGTWRGSEPLSTFIGDAGDGTWQLNVADVAGIDTGSLRSVSLHLSGFVTAGI